jgi:hypothetical protein
MPWEYNQKTAKLHQLFVRIHFSVATMKQENKRLPHGKCTMPKGAKKCQETV